VVNRLDYVYGIFFKTYNLPVVEFVPLPNKLGVQMLWQNPPGFESKSGEYVKIHIPWLQHGGNEWHPFSIYRGQEESTLDGLDNMYHAADTKRDYDNEYRDR
jgi:hypothetical protein